MQRIGVQRRLSAFLTGLLLASLLAAFVPASSSPLLPEEAQAVGPPVYACASLFTGALRYSPSGACSPNETLVNLNGEPSITVCASLYTGMLRYPFGGPCTSTERSLLLPGVQAVNLCANRSTGRLRYQPNGACPAGEGLILVPQANDPPVAADDEFTVDEDSVLGGNVLADNGNGPDSDIEGDPLSVNPTPLSGPSNGMVALAANGDFTYTPNPDFFGVDTFTYQLLDGQGGTDVGLVTITVNPLNDDPIANPQSVTTDEDVAVVITLTGTDVDGDTLTFAIDTGPTSGTLSSITPVDATSAQVTYTPDPDYSGPDSFTFTVNDGTTTSPAATVSITVDAVNDAPVADAQMVSTDEDTPLVITLTGSDVDGDSLTFAIDTGPTNGTLGPITPIDATSAQVTYTPNADYNGPDSFTFTANDGTADSAPATVAITIGAVNDAPVADAQSVTTDEDTPITITLTGSDVDGDALAFAIDTGPANGSLGAITPIDATSAQVTYTPDPDFNGPDSFTFTVNDGTLDSSAATVSITVDPLNDAPVADAQMVSTDEDVPLVITLTGTDVDGDALTFAIDTAPTNGTLGAITQLTPTSAQVTYTPDPDYSGPDSFTFTVNDGTVDSSAATVSITVDPLNDAPVADAQMVSTDEDTPLVITLTGSDVDGDALTFAIASPPPNGTLSAITQLTPTSAQVTYTPNADFNGPDSFTFTANDGAVDSSPATVSITVDPVNDAPIADAQMVTTDEDTPLVITLTGSDVDGDSLTFAIATDPAIGTLGTITQLTPTSAQVTYTPNLNANGPDSFTFTVNDGAVDSAPATVTITVTAVDDPPTADDDSATVLEDSAPNAIDVLANDDDVDLGPMMIVGVQDPSDQGGDVQITGGGTGLTYEPAPDYCNDPPGTTLDTFTYTLNGGSTATVTVTVTCVNDPPAIDLDADDSGGTGGADFAVSYTENAGGLPIVDSTDATITDVDSTTLVSLTVTISNLQDVGQEFLAADASGFPDITVAYVSATGVLTISSVTPQDIGDYQMVLRTVTYEHSGEDPTGAPARLVEFVANDGADDSNTATSTVTVVPVDDPPVAFDDSATVLEDSGANAIDVLANDTDVDGGPKTVDTVQSPSAFGGTVLITGGGTGLSYEPALNYCNDPPGTDPDTFTYTLNGGDMATVSVTVTCVNDPPLAGADSFDFIGNTELRVDTGASATPHALETTGTMNGALANDSEPEGDAFEVTSITVGACTDNTGPTFDCTDLAVGTVSMNADGTFSFVPAPGDTGATEVFTYTITDDGLPAPASAVGTVTLNRFERVWYVDPAAGGGGDGTSASPFNTLTPLSGAGGTGDSDLTGDYLFVHDGTLALGGPLPLEGSQHLIGQGVGLSVPVNLNGNGSPTNLVAAGAQPQLTNASGDAVTIGAAIPIEIVGLSLASTSGNAIDLTAAAALSGAGTLLIGNNEFRGAGAEGIDVNLNAGTSGTLGLTIQTNTWAAGTHTGNAVDISHAAGAGTLNLAFDSNTGLRSNIHALVIDGGAAASTTITSFANNSVHGDTALTGVQISTATFDATPGGAVQQVNAGTLPIGASGNPVGGPGLRLIAVLGNLLFSDLDIFATSSGLTLTGTAGSTSFNVTPPGSGGSSTIVADAGPAVTVTGAALDLQLADMDSTTASDGVNLNTVSGQFSAPSGSTITKASGGGTGFVVTNSSLTVNYAGTVNVSSGAGVSLTSNTGTMNFTGQLTLNTGANAAFAATGSGTVTATATNSTLTTTTGTALNVANVTIGAGGLNFESISSNGAANGIILNNTGSTAGLTVTGNGNTSVGGDNSGGTIQNATSHGISLTSTSNVSLTNMRILNTSGSGVDGTLVTNFAFLNGRIDNVGTGGGVNTSNIAFNDDAAVTENNLAGAVTITGNVLTNAFYHGVDIFNFDGTLSNATISNNTITSSTSTATSKGSGVRLVAFGSATTVAHVTKATLDNNTISNFPSGAGIVASGGNAGGAPGTFGVPNDATNIIAITNNLIAGNSPANRMSINAIQAVVNGAGQGNFNISNNGTLANPLTNVTGNVIVNSAIGDVTVTSTISNNVIVANHTANVGGALGISAGADSVLPACTIGGTCDNPSFTLTISGNAVSQTDASGIFVRSVNNTGSLTLKVLNNNVAAPLSGFREGIQVHSGSSAGTGNTSVCLEITGNISAGQNGADGIGFRKQGTNSTVHAFAIEGMVATSSPGVETYVHGLNSSADGSADGDALGVTLISATSGFTNCSIP